jgi:hypothetical protein
MHHPGKIRRQMRGGLRKSVTRPLLLTLAALPQLMQLTRNTLL